MSKISLTINCQFVLAFVFITHNFVLPQEKYSEGPYFKNISTLSDVAEDLIDVLHYDIYLNISPYERTIYGYCGLTIRIMKDQVNQFSLDLIGFAVDSILVNQKKFSFKRSGSQLNILLNNAASADDTLLAVVFYNGQPGNDGFGGFFFTDRFAYTVGQGIRSYPPSMLHYWLPSHDEPFDKATVDFQVTVPKDFQAISNGTLVQVTETDRGRKKIYHWRETHPVAPYLIAVSVGNYSYFSDRYISVTGDTIPLNYYVYPEHLGHAKIDWENVADMLTFFENKFGSYPFDSYGMVEVPMRGAMEHQTMTSMSAGFLTGTHFYDYIVVHELAHQWWGDYVTIGDWRDLWLNEGFATYCEALYLEYLHGPEALIENMKQFKDGYLLEVNQRGHFPIYDPDYLWGGTIYEKGAWVLHMLRWNVGDSMFWRCLNNYAAAYPYGNAVTDDFVKIVEETVGREMKNFFTQWIYWPGMPHLEVSWEYSRKRADEYTVELEIQQEPVFGNFFEFPVELLVRTEKDTHLDTVVIKGEFNVFSFVLNNTPVELVLDPNSWVLVKINIVSEPLPPGFAKNKLGLTQNYPNPFIPEEASKTYFDIQIAAKNAPMPVILRIYNVQGETVKTLVDGILAQGLYSKTWNGTDDFGRPVSGGVYFCQLEAGGKKIHKKMILMR